LEARNETYRRQVARLKSDQKNSNEESRAKIQELEKKVEELR
jgi:hypothetical protein